MFGLDLHTVVRGAVTAVHPDERVVRYRSVGQSNVRGKMVPAYAEPETLDAQIQSEKDDALVGMAGCDGPTHDGREIKAEHQESTS